MTGTLAQNVMNLNESEQQQLFSLITDHADLFIKVIPQIPLLEYIATGSTINAGNDPLIHAYSVWKTKNS